MELYSILAIVVLFLIFLGIPLFRFMSYGSRPLSGEKGQVQCYECIGAHDSGCASSCGFPT